MIQVDLVLGGHDHDYACIPNANGRMVVKSGTEFRNLSLIEMDSRRSNVPLSGMLFTTTDVEVFTVNKIVVDLFHIVSFYCNIIVSTSTRDP